MNADRLSAQRLWLRLAPWFVLVAAVAGYLGTFGCPFIFDDASIGAIRASSIRPSFGWIDPRGLVRITFVLNVLADGKNPAGFHAVNILLHTLAALFLYGLVRRTLLLPVFKARFSAFAASGLAAVSAAIWAAHPLQTESVTYVCQRYEVMMGMMLLLTLYAFVRSTSSTKPIPWLVISGLSCWLGMGTKESMAVAPVLVVLYDYCLVSNGWQGVVARWRFHGVLILSLGFLFLLRHHAVNSAVAGGYAMTYPTVPPTIYLMTQFGVILHYLRLVFIPTGQCLDYAWLPVESIRQAILPGLLIVGAGIAALWALLRRRPVGYLGAWFFVTLAPSSSVFPLHDLAFEHRMYLPLAAVVVFVVTAVYGLLRRLDAGTTPERVSATVGGALAILCLVILLGATVRRNEVYGSAETMWNDVLAKAPHNERQRVALIVNLNQQERYGEAMDMGVRLVDRLKVAREAKSRPAHRIAATDPDVLYPPAVEELGVSFLFQGQPEVAALCFREVLPVRSSRRLHHNLSLALLVEGQVDEAVREIQAATALEPGNATSWAFQGFLLSLAGHPREAVQAYQRAVENDPTLVTANIELAWLLATSPDDSIRNGKRAVELAESALHLAGGHSARGLDVLAAAYAEMGRFREAIETVKEAIDLEKKAGPKKRGMAPSSTAELRKRLAAYELGQAFREEGGPTSTSAPVETR